MGCPARTTRALSTGLSSPYLWPPECPDHLIGEDTGFSQGAAGLCRSIWSQARHPMWSCQGAPTMHDPIDDLNGDDVMESSLLTPVEEESWPSPTLEEESILLGEENGLSGVPVPAPLQAEIPRFVEPAEWTTTLVTSTVPHSCPSLKRDKSQEGTEISANNSGWWVHTYLEKNNRLLEWWEEFHSLVYSMDGCCNDAQAKNMACQQPVAFHLPATQKEVYGAWTTPLCLSVLRRKEYLGSKDPQMTQDYWVVLREETIILAIILQQCTIHARAPPDVFCGAVQQLHECLAPVIEESNLFNMEKEILAGLEKTLWLLLPQQEPPCKNSPFTQKSSITDDQSRGAYPLYFTWPSIHTQTRRDGAPLRNWPWC